MYLKKWWTLVLFLVLYHCELFNSRNNSITEAASLHCNQSLLLDRFYGCAFRMCLATDDVCEVTAIDFENWILSKHPLLSAFPVDPDTSNGVRIVRNALFARSNPTSFSSGGVQLIGWSDDAIANILDLDPCTSVEDESFVAFVSGGVVHHSSVPLAHRYGGHQFGYWASQLGDGRAHIIGEYVSLRTNRRWELQLKGSGRTPFSRDGDGRAVLRSSIREFLASEAMYHLGVATSRAATLAMSKDVVTRDPLYNGQFRREQTAVVLRVAPSWFRFGSFELLAHSMETDLLRQLADFVITHHYTGIHDQSTNRYAALFDAVLRRTARTTALWQGFGFVHGVLNTDNMSVLGLTIDYGPFQFIDQYDPEHVSNGSDDEGRYRLSRQPRVAKQNLQYLLAALSTIMSTDERSEASVSLKHFDKVFQAEHDAVFRQKIGLVGGAIDEDDGDCLVKSLLRMMSEQAADYTATFRQLSELSMKDLRLVGDGVELEGSYWAVQQLAQHKGFKQWIGRYNSRLERQRISDEQRRRVMLSNNPRYVLRNWMAEDAIRRAENGDYSRLQKLYRILSKPFLYQSEAENIGYASRTPYWASNLTVTCSS